MRSSTFVLGAIAALFAASVFGADMSPVGSWRTIDDKTGKVKSIVEISNNGGKLVGKVAQILQSDKGPNPTCDACSGERKDKPITGMTILWDVVQDGDVWDGGTILDPNNGKSYSVKLTPIENGSKLQVRGFMGFSWLGRTQVWERVTP
jgi:uncharacterized protein (DUF2147 family)